MRIYDATTFGKAIKKARKEQGITQKELADACGCSTVYLSQLENGKATAELGLALRVMSTLALNMNVHKRTGEDL